MNENNENRRVYDDDMKADLFRSLMLHAFVRDDELKTRANFIALINNSIKEHPEDDALREAYEEMSQVIDQSSYEEMEDFYDNYCQDDEEDEIIETHNFEEEDKNMSETNTPLLAQLNNAKKNEKITLSYEDEDDIELTFNRKFIFEGDIYVVFKVNKKDEYCYKYQIDRNGEEKLIPVDEPNQIRFFEFLKL